MKFFSLPNLSTEQVEVLEAPWDVRVPEDVLSLDKEAYKARWTDPNVHHWLLSMAQGQNPDFCISPGNQASVLYGYMADYDGVLTPDLIDQLHKKHQGKYAPAYWCLSQSGKLHLFWFFERPIAVTGNRHATELLKIVAKKVRAARWGVGYDPSCESATQIMDIGREWHGFEPESRVPAEDIVLWDMALFERTAKELCDDVVDIPVDVVVAEIRKREWPHRAPGDLRVGARCIRFWDPGADNVSAAQMTKDGFRVYTPHDNGFKGWKSLLGAEFCEQYTAKSMAPFYEDTTYCQSKDEYWRFFRNDVPARFEKRTEKVLRRDLVKEAQLDPKVPKGGELSEVDNVLYAINRKNSVDAVAPVIYRKTGRIEVDGIGRVLNTSTVVVKQPAGRFTATPEDLAKFPLCPDEYRLNPGRCRWDNPFAVSRFPHIHHLMTAYFMTRQAEYDAWEDGGFQLHDASGAKPFLHDPQLTYLVSWMSHFYVNAARMPRNPDNGLALFLAGPASTGKSFFGRVLLGQLMGGFKDADDFYLKGSRFNSGIVSSPVHVVDDKLGSRDRRARLQFTEVLKSTVANATIRYEAKFGSALESVPWPGRIVILSNEDAQSLSVMPDLDMATRDKFLMLKFGGVHYRFGSKQENQRWLSEELPYFARFLLEWEIPVAIRDVHNRFGLKAIQNADMAQASAENGYTQTVVEILETCIEECTGTKDEKELSDAGGWAVEGNAVKVLKWIRSIVDPTLGKEIANSHDLQIGLQTLYKNGGYNIAYDEQTRRWKIPYVLRKAQLTPSTEV